MNKGVNKSCAPRSLPRVHRHGLLTSVLGVRKDSSLEKCSCWGLLGAASATWRGHLLMLPFLDDFLLLLSTFRSEFGGAFSWHLATPRARGRTSRAAPGPQQPGSLAQPVGKGFLLSSTNHRHLCKYNVKTPTPHAKGHSCKEVPTLGLTHILADLSLSLQI